MSERLAVLDTNVLGKAADLNSPLWVSIKKLCAEANITLCLPGIVFNEALNLRREEYQKAQKEFLESNKQIGRYFDLPAVYVPDVEEVIEKWTSDLTQMFKLLPGDPVDASEALTREATRKKPAKGGRGARDALIWLTCRRLAEGGAEVLFVSRNTGDFAAGDGKSWHPDLAREIEGGVAENLHYLANLDAFIDRIAERVDGPDLSDFDELESLLGFEIWDFALEGWDAPEGDESMVQIHWDFSEVRALRSYRVGDRGLALVDGMCSVSETRDHSGRSLAVKFMAWLGFDLETRSPLDGEIVMISARSPLT